MDVAEWLQGLGLAQYAAAFVESMEYVAALEDYTRAEPLPWSDLFAARGRLLAGAARGNLIALKLPQLGSSQAGAYFERARSRV